MYGSRARNASGVGAGAHNSRKNNQGTSRCPSPKCQSAITTQAALVQEATAHDYHTLKSAIKVWDPLPPQKDHWDPMA